MSNVENLPQTYADQRRDEIADEFFAPSYGSASPTDVRALDARMKELDRG